MRPLAVLLLCLCATHQVARGETSTVAPAPQAITPPLVAATEQRASSEPAATEATTEPPAAAPPAVDLNFSNLYRRLAARLARPSYAARSRFGPPAVETEGFGVQVERDCGEAKRSGR